MINSCLPAARLVPRVYGAFAGAVVLQETLLGCLS